MTAIVEMRLPDAGFVYINGTRMLFAPLFTSTRREEDRDIDDLILSETNWGTPTADELKLAVKALKRQFQNRNIWLDDTMGGFRLVAGWPVGESATLTLT